MTYYSVMSDFPPEWGDPPPMHGNDPDQIRRRREWIDEHTRGRHSRGGRRSRPGEMRARLEETRAAALDTGHPLDGDGNDLVYDRIEAGNQIATATRSEG
jgi:hypothetical protein